MRTFEKGKPFMDVVDDVTEVPIFSETFLYSKMCKMDARFILAVAEEYAKVIEKLGTETLLSLLMEKEEYIRYLRLRKMRIEEKK